MGYTCSDQSKVFIPDQEVTQELHVRRQELLEIEEGTNKARGDAAAMSDAIARQGTELRELQVRAATQLCN